MVGADRRLCHHPDAVVEATRLRGGWNPLAVAAALRLWHRCLEARAIVIEAALELGALTDVRADHADVLRRVKRALVDDARCATVSCTFGELTPDEISLAHKMANTSTNPQR